MYRLLFFLLCFCISCTNKISINKWDDSLTAEQNVAGNAIAFNTNDDFLFLDGLSKTRQVIILGESGHHDLSTSEVKIKMIKYLQNKGFNSTGLEMGPFLTSYVFSNDGYSDITKTWKIEEFWIPVWTNQRTCTPLIEMINKHEVKIWGIDIKPGKYDIIAAKAILNKYFQEFPFTIDWNILEKKYNTRFLISYDSLSVSEQYDLMHQIDSIYNYTQYIISQKGTTNDLKAITQWIRNINSWFVYTEIDFTDSITTSLLNTFGVKDRDRQMAENILWITENFPAEKFTVWCANFHGAKDISQTTYPTDSLAYFKYPVMGESVYNKLRNKLYSLACTSLKSEKEPGKLELEISKVTNNAPYAFIDCEPLRYAKGYRDKEFESSVIKKKQGKWLHIFDGIYYIRDQETNYK